ncbi:MAG: GTPase Era, partial [Candidatus Omnitrophica bacterium]|nr:GTPase Era [Candidatus Omnitrophota bacterium]
EEADVVIWVTDASRGVTEEDRRLSKLVPPGKPVVVAVNKIDRVAKPKLLPQMEELSKMLPDAEIMPIAAATRDGTHFVLEAAVKHLPAGDALFPDDQWTDRPTRFLAAELIREQILLAVRDELPHAVAVSIEEWARRKRRTTRRVRGHEKRNPIQPIVYMRACIWVERPTQKAIVVGAKGELLKNAGTAARQAIEKLLGENVYLDLWVKVKENWREKPHALKELGY